MDRAGAEIAALTHTHPLGYIPAAILTHIISAVVYEGCTYGNCLEDIVMEAIEVVPDLFEDKEYNNELQMLLKKQWICLKTHLRMRKISGTLEKDGLQKKHWLLPYTAVSGIRKAFQKE